jgi:hypothetical protein
MNPKDHFLTNAISWGSDLPKRGLVHQILQTCSKSMMADQLPTRDFIVPTRDFIVHNTDPAS